MERPKILVVCGRNKRRSRTAEHIYRNDNRIQIRSAGLSPSSNRRLTESDLHWADLLFVMEESQRSKLKDQFGNLDLPEFVILHIPDDYEYMDEELIAMLRSGMESTLEKLNHKN